MCLHAFSTWLPLKYLESECTFAFPSEILEGFSVVISKSAKE